MPPSVASAVYCGLVIFLLWRELRQKPNVTRALWLPTVWLLAIGSRSISQWLEIAGFNVGGLSLEEGSPVDAVFYFALIIGGVMVLRRRQVYFGEVFYHNRWLMLFLIYCLVSVLWSDYPFVSFKRWIKILGHPIMTLVVFTEPDLETAFIQLMKRAAYVLVPISLLFIKYYPAWGRQFDPWSGQPVNTGVCSDKNSLGCICLIFCFGFFWYFQKLLKMERSPKKFSEIFLCGGMLLASGWLMYWAHSSTSWVTLFIAIGVMLFLGLPFLNRRAVGFYFAAGIAVLVVAQFGFGLSDFIIATLGKDPTLTDRTKLWHTIWQIPINPVVGTGFESFWLGERKDTLWAIWWWRPVQAHNGYLETYINLGVVGLALMVILLISTFRKAAAMLLYQFEFARFRIGFLMAFLLYNWTEAAFKALHPMWFVLYLIAIDLPKPEPDVVEAEVVAENLPEGLEA